MGRRRRKVEPQTVEAKPAYWNPVTISLTVRNESTKAPINDASVSLHVDSDRGIFTGELVNQNGYYSINLPPELPKPYGADIMAAAEGYIVKIARVTIPESGQINVDPVELDTDFLFPKETGPITVSGTQFWNQYEPWYMRGVTMFMLFARYQRGENIMPQINWMRKWGFNVARVLGPVDWSDWPDYRTVDWGKFREFLAVARDNGIRIMWVPITTRENSKDHQSLVDNSIVVCNDYNNTLLQVCNEPLKDGKCDPVELIKRSPFEFNGMLDYGIYWADDWPSVWPLEDFGSVHLTREYPKFARKSKDLLELRMKFGKPFIHDEPIGVDEIDQPGRRTTDIDALVDDAAVALLCGNGYVYHFQYGLQGLNPPEGSIQDKVAERLSALYQFIPDFVSTGAYAAPHIAGFPMEWKESDSEVIHAYGGVLGNTAYVVNILPTVGWEPKGINGWTVASSLGSSIFRLVR
tara:strand:- start:9591 stop:10985 length:1395 start_codon:yes stop_codon:yes gene_type:complete